MKKFGLLLSLVLVMFANDFLLAQQESYSFFGKNGDVALETTQLDALSDTIAIINHRTDDVVWSRTVYRVIDMREQQNNQLYFPLVPNERYKSLFRLILEETLNENLTAYDKKEADIMLENNSPIETDSLRNYYVHCDWDSVDNVVMKSFLIEQNPLTRQSIISDYNYPEFASKQTKFLIQELVFFNRHYSRMYTKIIGIAPLYMYNETNVTKLNLLGPTKTGEAIWSYFQSSVICWYLFDQLRPLLAKQYIVPNGNDTERMTFDEFFAQRLYQDYLLGDSNMFDRTIIQSFNTPEKVRKEQKKIETELLNIEQDLWEY